MKEATAVPVSKWGEGVAVSLPTIARRWGLSEDETLEMFGLIPTIGNEVAEDGEEIYDGDVTICVAETGERLWMAQHILFAEGDLPELADGRGCEMLAALRALKSAVDAMEPDMFGELLHETGMARETLSADRLTVLAGLEPSGLRAEFARLDAILDERHAQMLAARNAGTEAVAL